MEPHFDSTETGTHLSPGVGLAVFALDGKLLFANRNFRNMPWCRQNVLSDLETFIHYIIHRATDKTIAANISRIDLKSEIPTPVGLTIAPHDDIHEYVDIHLTTVTAIAGDIIGTAVIAVDATSWEKLKKEHGKMELEYLNAGRMAILGELTGGIAHNINNPLAGLLGYLELMTEDYPEDQRIKKCINQCRRIADLTQNLAYHGRNALMTAPVNLDVNELIAETLLLISASKLFNNLKIYIDLSPTPLIVAANPGDLTQVLLNILHNARDAVWGKTDGCITITSSAKENNVIVSVADNGTGIPDEIIDRIFDPFFTTKSRTPMPNQSPTGNGLGLSTALQLVEQYAGRIEVATEPGKGSTFQIILPMVVTET